jgi:hypothetical protein
VEPAHRPERAEAFDLLPRHPDNPLELEPLAEANLRRSDQGETLAVLALLLPLVARCLLLAYPFDSWWVVMALNWGTVGVTALLLAVDAALMGTFDLKGTRRGSPAALFIGVLALWIVCYPVAFFRRRHFGRPNLGLLAVLVAGFFVGVPFAQQFLAFGVLGGGPPTCTSREVVAMVDDLIRKGYQGPPVQSITGHREISYDPASQTRKGQCLVQTAAETIPVHYTVKTLDRLKGTFQVEVEPVIPADPPPCTNPEVIGLVERILREGPNGPRLRSVTGHEEVRYDRERKVRHCRCRVALQEPGPSPTGSTG